MESYLYVFGILVVGFILYMIVRDYIFDTVDTITADSSELFESIHTNPHIQLQKRISAASHRGPS